MTSIVGVLCRDGVVVGADSSSTFVAGHQPTIEQPTQKIKILGDRVIVAGSGQVGLAQRFAAVVEGRVKDIGVSLKTPLDCGKTLSKGGIDDFGQTNAPKGQFGALVAFACKDAPHLCEFVITDFQPELKDDRLWYVSLGSAQPITDPFLGFLREVFWDSGPPNLQDGVFSVVWTLEQACRLNTGGVKEPIHISILEKNPSQTSGHPWIARMLPTEEIDLHRQNVAAARKHLGEFRNRHQAEAASDVDPPKPPAGVPNAPLPPAPQSPLKN